MFDLVHDTAVHPSIRFYFHFEPQKISLEMTSVLRQRSSYQVTTLVLHLTSGILFERSRLKWSCDQPPAPSTYVTYPTSLLRVIISKPLGFRSKIEHRFWPTYIDYLFNLQPLARIVFKRQVHPRYISLPRSPRILQKSVIRSHQIILTPKCLLLKS